PDKAYWDTDVEYQPVYRLSQDLDESINLMAEVEELLSRLPGLDCGSCGAPSCKALAEDVARGIAKEKDCIYILKDYIHRLSDEISN
ncbi:MAG: ferredoxin, partial [Clostridiales bacterium]|nr:ferredoxin [Clostridiales bacterium]